MRASTTPLLLAALWAGCTAAHPSGSSGGLAASTATGGTSSTATSSSASSGTGSHSTATTSSSTSTTSGTTSSTGTSGSSGGSGTALLIYQGGNFAPGWTSSNWSNNCPGSSPTASLGGATVLEVDLTCGQYNGNFVVDWSASTSMATYPTLSFDLEVASTSDLNNLTLSVQETDSTRSVTEVPLSAYLTSPVAGAFNHVSIPLSAVVDSGTTSYVGFVFRYTTATGAIFYLNSVEVSGGAATGSSTGGTSGASTTSTSSTGSTTGTTSSGAVTFSIDMAQGPARQFQPPSQPTPISPYVYGINGFGSFVAQRTRWGLIRKGGDAFTDWNWGNNYSNSAADYCFWQGQEGSASVAGAIIDADGDSLPNAQAQGEAYLATVPIVDHVSAAFDNNTGINNLCPGTASCSGKTSYAVNSGNLDFASTDPSSTAFVANAPSKPGGSYCTCPGPSCGSGCTVATSGTVYQDEFVNYLKVNYGSGAPIFFELDNEPNFWGSTHPEVWPFTGTVPCQSAAVTYDDIVGRDTQYAAAIKAAWPAAKVFGPVVAQDGLVYAHSYASDARYPTEFLDYYLQQMASASTQAGHPLLDVLDVHYYNSGSDPAQCVQSPRMFWDPSYTSLSPSGADALDFGWSGINNYFDTNWYPRQVIPRLLGKIATAYPAGGTAAPGLAFSEYNSGCEDQIAGGVAEADNLGIFGREGVYAATAWPLQSPTSNYLVAAFDAYRNYDGQGATVGDTAVLANTSDVASASIYAFDHSTNAAALELVAINKTGAGLTASISVTHAPSLSGVTLYRLVDGSAAVVAAGSAPSVGCSGGTCTLTYILPAMSVTTLVLR